MSPSHRVSKKKLLSPRQVEVLRLYVRGYSRDKIATELEIAPSTVEEHLQRVQRKFKDSGRESHPRRELMFRAAEEGIA
jgi:two-component system, NarL family, uhpT operon response regulator UhpA